MYEEAKQKAKAAMDKAIESLKRDLGKVRTGRASLTLLEDVRVDYYGTPTPLNQIGTLAVPEPRLITIQPWEKNLISEIERAIMKSDLGLNPNSDGTLIRIAIPALTEERRREMVKLLRRNGEECKIGIRNARRDANDTFKKLLKDKQITEDDQTLAEKEIQELTDAYVKKVDEILDNKEKEVMEI